MSGKKAQVDEHVCFYKKGSMLQITFTLVGDMLVQSVVRDGNEREQITFKADGQYMVAVGVCP